MVTNTFIKNIAKIVKNNNVLGYQDSNDNTLHNLCVDAIQSDIHSVFLYNICYINIIIIYLPNPSLESSY